MWKWRYVHENYTDTLAICTVWWWSVVVVVVLCGSGGYNIYILYIRLRLHTWWFHSCIATCAGGVFPCTHWRRYQAYAQETCTVWWCFSVVVVDAYLYVVAVVVAVGCVGKMYWC